MLAFQLSNSIRNSKEKGNVVHGSKTPAGNQRSRIMVIENISYFKSPIGIPSSTAHEK